MLCHQELFNLLQKLGGVDGGNVDIDDCSKFTNLSSLKNWKTEELIESIRDRFVTGDWSKAALRGKQLEATGDDDDDAVFGEFEDLETGEKYEGDLKGNNGDDETHKDDDTEIEERRLKKLALRAKFDAQYPSLLILVLDPLW